MFFLFCSVCAVKSKEDFQTGLRGQGQPGRGQRGHHRVRWDLGLGCHFPPSHTSRDYFDFDRFDSPAFTILWLVKATAFFPLIPPCAAEREAESRGWPRSGPRSGRPPGSDFFQMAHFSFSYKNAARLRLSPLFELFASLHFLVLRYKVSST